MQLSVDHLDFQRAFGVLFIDPVISQLRHPAEVLDVCAVLIKQRLDDVFSVDVDGDQRA